MTNYTENGFLNLQLQVCPQADPRVLSFQHKAITLLSSAIRYKTKIMCNYDYMLI